MLALNAILFEPADSTNNNQITVSIPQNTTVVGGVVSRTTLRLPTDLTFADFYSRVCARMDLDPQSARIGYKLSGDRVRDASNQLFNAVDYRLAVEKVLEKARRARHRDVVLELFNLVCISRSVVYNVLSIQFPGTCNSCRRR